MTESMVQQYHNGQLQHLLQIEGLPQQVLIAIMDEADRLIQSGQHRSKQLSALRDKTVINLFCESSTRTRISFELAARRLGAEVITLDSHISAIQKGESLLDTIFTLQAMHCDFFVIRHPENNAVEKITQHVNPGVAVINAGDGSHAHPTQALLDVLTIRQHKPNFSRLSIAIVGDIIHSRVANSLITALQILQVNDIRLLGPKSLLPSSTTSLQCESNLTVGLEDVDVIVSLRVQKERIKAADLLDINTYEQEYSLTETKLACAKPDAIVMHPGPINREVEITSAVADGPQSVIQQQVSNGIAVRMAVMRLLKLGFGQSLNQ